jgi:aminobenzoyl-glutamate utilization protein B
LDIADGADSMAGTTHKARFLTGVHNGIPNRTLAESIVANMRLIGAPTYTEEEEEFAATIAKSYSKQQKMRALIKWRLPDASDLVEVNLNTKIYEPYGEWRQLGGSSDVSEVSWNMPTQEFITTAFILGSPAHSWQYTAASGSSIGEKSSIFASKVMATTALDLFIKPEIVKKAKEEWMEKMKNRKYRCPLPLNHKPPLNQLEPQ